MSRYTRLVALSLIAAGPMLIVSGPAAGDDPGADWTIVQDKKESFWATGVFITTDTGPPGIGGATIGVGGVNWRFRLSHTVADWSINPPAGGVPGADDAKISIQGRHIDGPHDDDVDPNMLPAVDSKAVDIPFGATKVIAVSNTRKHPTGSSGDHFDHYGVRQWATAAADEDGEPPVNQHSIGGLTQVRAKHNDRTKDSQPKWETIGASWEGGSTVSYDARAQQIIFNIQAIDILNRSGRLTPGIDQEYLDDPARNFVMVAAPMPLLRVTGRYVFGPGHVELIDPANERSFSGHIEEYLIGQTTRTEVFDSYGLLTQMHMEDLGSVEEGGSAFLQNFWDINVFGIGVPEHEWLDVVGIDFAFVSTIDLAQATRGFTQSVWDVPATYVITCNAVPRQSLELTSLSVNTGTRLRGGLNALRTLGGNTLDVVSEHVNNRSHRTMITVRAASELTHVDDLSMRFALSASQPQVAGRIQAYNWEAARWDTLHNFVVPIQLLELNLHGIPNANDYVRDSDGEVRVRLRTSADVLWSEDGYIASYDFVGIKAYRESQ